LPSAIFRYYFIKTELSVKVLNNYQRFFNSSRSGSGRQRFMWAVWAVVMLAIGGFFAVNYPLQTTFLVLLAASIFTIGRE
jgi:hypothetical protein